MDKIINFVKKVFYPTCAIYMFISFFVLAISAADSDKPALTLSSMALFLLMSFFIALSGLIFYVKKLSVWLKAALHMLLCLISVSAAIYIFNLLGTRGDLSVNKLLLSFAFCVAYIIIALPIIAVYLSLKKKQAQKTEYTPMFKKNK